MVCVSESQVAILAVSGKVTSEVRYERTLIICHLVCVVKLYHYVLVLVHYNASENRNSFVSWTFHNIRSNYNPFKYAMCHTLINSTL